MLRSKILRLLVVAGGLLALSACQDNPVRPSTPEQPDSVSSSRNAVLATSAQSDTSVNFLARAVAVALADPSLRRQLLEDLRDSPFFQHRIHYTSYLRGARGGALLESAARAAGTNREQLLARIQSLPAMEIGLPRGVDRAFWAGGDTILVVAVSVDPAQIGPEVELNAYNVRGEPTKVSRFSAPRATVIAIRPASINFGSDPESVRAQAPKRTRPTVSTREVEFPRVPTPTGLGASRSMSSTAGTAEGVDLSWLGLTYSHCTQVEWSADADADYVRQDRDRDGFRDRCEYEIANAFAPQLRFHPQETMRGREEHWAARPIDTSFDPKGLDVIYLHAYYADSGHHGDSEFIRVIAIDPENDGIWAFNYMYTSAHWGGIWGGLGDASGPSFPTTTYYAGNYRSRPVVWVSAQKHANYPSLSLCNDHPTDDCSSSGYWENMLTYYDRNIGNYYSTGVQLIGTVYKAGIGENFWTYTYFCGWYITTPCAGGYDRITGGYAY